MASTEGWLEPPSLLNASYFSFHMSDKEGSDGLCPGSCHGLHESSRDTPRCRAKERRWGMGWEWYIFIM